MSVIQPLATVQPTVAYVGSVPFATKVRRSKNQARSLA
jgi:hypothetical protein